MAKQMKRGAAMLCVVILVVSMFAVPASAASNDWEFQFTSSSTITDRSARWGTYTKVSFRFRGTGIQRIQLMPWYTNQYRPVEAYIPSGAIQWRPARQWCNGYIMVRGRYGGTGTIDIHLMGSSAMCRTVTIE